MTFLIFYCVDKNIFFYKKNNFVILIVEEKEILCICVLYRDTKIFKCQKINKTLEIEWEI